MEPLLRAHIFVLTSAILIILAGTLFFAPLKWVAFIPVLYILSDKTILIKKKIYYGWLLGFFIVLAHFSFILDMYPLDWMGIPQSTLAIFLPVIVWTLFSIIHSIPLIIVSLSHYSIYLFPFLWVLSEYIRSWFYSLIIWGDSSSLGDNFSLGAVGYSIHSSEILLASAPYFNIFTFSFFIVTINLLLYKGYQLIYLQTFTKKAVFIIVFLILLGSIELIPLSFFQDSKEPAVKTLNVAAVQGPESPPALSYTNELFESTTQYYTEVIEDILTEHPDVDIIVLPEFARIIDFIVEQTEKGPQQVAQDILNTNKYRLLVYGNYNYEKLTSMTTAISNNPSEKVQHVEKVVLMPFGEYQPYLAKYIAQRTGATDWFNTLSDYRTTFSGTHYTNRIFQTKIANISPVTCSEILSHKIYDEIKSLNPDIITHHQRLATFHDSKRVFNHTLLMSKFHAARTQKYIIGAVDGGGYPYIISPQGKVVALGDHNSSYIYKKLQIQ